MNKIKSSLLFFLSLALASTGNAQSIKSFSTEPAAFLKDLESCFAETNKKEAEKIVEAFAPVFNTKYSAQQQQTIMVTSNNMLKKRMKGYPDFVHYVQALTAFATSGQTEATFTAWHSTLDKTMGKLNVRRFGDYLEICNLLFTNNTLYESSSVRWAADNNKYSFEFDSLPKIVFPALTLTCYAKGDSSAISTTKGFYYPNNLLFYGFGGKVNFTRAGIANTDAFAELKKYAINLKGAEYGMDSVTFSYKKYFTEQLKGRYIDKLLANVTDSTASYPRFVSYQTNLSIKDLIKDADYKGGFSLQGSKMVGSGSRTQDASLTFYRNGKKQLVMLSKGFVVKKDRIVSVNAAAIIYFDKDSIFHPGVEFKYIYGDRKVTLIKNTQTAVNSPYFDSYHKMDLDFEELLWKMDDPIMDLKMVTGAGESKLKFESVNYFSRERFEKIQGISEVHPLYTVKQFCEKNKTRVIHTVDLAQHMKLNENQVRNLLIGLSSLGFMAYDPDDDKAIVKEKVFYYLNARTGKVDYDGIKIESIISGKSNATINLLNFDINMEGVSRVLLSDSQEVYFVPTEQQLTLKKNRDMHFAGRVHAGRLDFFGKEFIFKYDDFKVDLKTVDSLRFKVPSDTMDTRGIYPLISIRSVLQQLNGELNIDNPTNKSGYVANNDFPVFNCTNKSFIYYDYAYIFNKVYSRDNFYYHLDPFSIDSLNSLRKEGLVFDGELVSAGIFPTFRQTLTVQPDYSLGFQMTTPGEGFSAYGGKGKYTNELSLSHKGLLGNGDIEYLTSTTSSNDIIFFPDSTYANAQNFTVKDEILGSTHFPDVKAEDVFVNWRPKADKMYVFKKIKNIALYKSTATLDGNLVLMPSGITANGTVTYDQSSLYSNNMHIKDHSYDADTANFNLRSNIGNVLALETKNVKANIDLEKRVGEFSSNGNNANVTFPLNQYVSNIQNFKWFMDKSEMEFGGDNAGMNIRESEFISIHPDQDSLRFTAPLATYNLNDYLIKGYKVKELLVADASIIPDSGKIIVEKNAVMRTLENSRVTANTTTRFHTMLNTSINVLGRQNYGGNGDYEYLDQSKVKHLIRLTQIGVDTAKQTFAIGEIPDTSAFSISPTIQYKGKIRIQAAKQNLYFSGFAIVNHHCETFEQNWFGFASDIDPRGVTIPISEPVNETNQKLFAGIFFAGDSTNIYPAFISQKKRSSDAEIISAQGYLTYDDVAKQYKIAGQKPDGSTGEKEKKKEKEETLAATTSRPVSNSVILDDKSCVLKCEGKINLTTNFGQMQVGNYGQVSFATANDSIYFDEIMTADFMFNEDALKIMSDIITQYPSLQPTNDSRPVYGNALVNMIGKDKADKLITETSLYGMTKKVPEELQHTLTLTDVKFFWSKERTAYYSKGPIGVGLAGKNYIGRMMFGKLEIIRRRSGDVFNLYVEVDGSIWFYFNYARGVMQAISSEEKFNFAIDNMKPEKRVASEKGGLDPYQFMLSTERKKSEFLKRLKDQGM